MCVHVPVCVCVCVCVCVLCKLFHHIWAKPWRAPTGMKVIKLELLCVECQRVLPGDTVTKESAIAILARLLNGKFENYWYRVVKAKVSVPKSRTLYVFFPNWDATGQGLKFQDGWHLCIISIWYWTHSFWRLVTPVISWGEGGMRREVENIFRDVLEFCSLATITQPIRTTGIFRPHTLYSIYC